MRFRSGRKGLSVTLPRVMPVIRQRLPVTACIWLALVLLASGQADQVYAVERVIDGDTVVLASLGPVRLIGIDTPETVDPREPVQAFGLEASAYLRSLLGQHPVRVEYDQQRIDKYRRVLAYLYLPDGTFVNREMVRQGYAHAYLTYPFRYMDDFREAEREAREAGRGLWGEAAQAATPASEPVRVWVNTSSRVYHCPGTRYYGNTARGQYMTESEATEHGYRPAYGRTCGPVSNGPATVTLPPSQQALAPTTTGDSTSPGASIRVWVNTSSRVYHCPGARYYGNTARGQYMTEAEARAAGNRPAYGKTCGPLTGPQVGSSSGAGRTSSVDADVARAAPGPSAASDARVWVNTASGVYHCSGTRYYGKTKAGTFMTESSAQAAGHRPAGGRACR